MELISWWQIYLFGMLPKIDTLFKGGMVVSSILVILSLIFAFADLMESNEGWRVIKKCRSLYICTVLVFFISPLIPSQQTVAAMYIIPAVVNNAEVQATAGEVLKSGKDGAGEILRAGKTAVVSTLELPPVISKFLKEYLKVEE